jgi:RNA polymerase sigma-70 factor (ECF subfamily)
VAPPTLFALRFLFDFAKEEEKKTRRKAKAAEATKPLPHSTQRRTCYTFSIVVRFHDLSGLFPHWEGLAMHTFDSTVLPDLLTRSRAGEVLALNLLLERTRPYLTVLARASIGRRLRAKADFEDLIQETHLQVAQEFARFQGNDLATFLAWLRTIFASRLEKFLRRYLGTQARKLSREQELSAALDNSSQLLGGLVPASPDRSPSSQVSNEEELLRVSEAMEQLPEDYREVLVLRYLEGASFADIAERMGRVSDEAARKLWTRALQALRRQLGVSV